MKKHQEKLNVVDENDSAIGEETRENIHKKGLLHQEIHVWVYNDKGEILFQRRSLDKDTHPGLLTASASGHVELNKDYKEAALKELKEETGISAKKEDLVFLKMVRSKTYDNLTGNINNVIRAVYTYKYQGDPRKLEIEEGEAIGFEFWPLEKIFNITEKEEKQFIPSVFSKQMLDIFKEIKKLL